MRISGADLLIDLTRYVGRPVVLTDGRVFNANNYYALIMAGGTGFYLSLEGIDRESYRYFLKNCINLVAKQCEVPLLVTPTDKEFGGMPIVKDVKMIQATR